MPESVHMHDQIATQPPTGSPFGDQVNPLLEKLRDIGLPEPTSWWPPAPGWWLVAAGFVGVVFFVAYRLRHRARSRRYKKEAADILATLVSDWERARDDRAFASDAQKLLRRVAIHQVGREEISRLTGRAFIDRINTLSENAISAETGELLTEAAYRREFPSGSRIDSIRSEIEAWLDALEGPARA